MKRLCLYKNGPLDPRPCLRQGLAHHSLQLSSAHLAEQSLELAEQQLIKYFEEERSVGCKGCVWYDGASPDRKLRIPSQPPTSAREEDRFVLRDLGSLNGTFVNGDRVSDRVLQTGDEITLGSTRIIFTGDETA